VSAPHGARDPRERLPARARLVRRAAFSATHALTMRVTRAVDKGRSGVNRIVAFPVRKGLNSEANRRRTFALATNMLQWSSNAAKYTSIPLCRKAGIW